MDETPKNPALSRVNWAGLTSVFAGSLVILSQANYKTEAGEVVNLIDPLVGAWLSVVAGICTIFFRQVTTAVTAPLLSIFSRPPR